MPGIALTFSKSQVNRAGELLRDWQGGAKISPSELAWANDVLDNFRAAHQYPLVKATMGLRSMVSRESARLDVSQRLKRRATILDKLLRQPDMALARMQDIGGCRAVLAHTDEVYRVLHRITRRGRVRRTVDYIALPAASGYRSLHVIVGYDDRAIEIQLRTIVQHEWAVFVERLGGQLDTDLKSGRGPREVLDFLAVASHAMALEEQGAPVDGLLATELSRLRQAATRYLTTDGGRR